MPPVHGACAHAVFRSYQTFSMFFGGVKRTCALTVVGWYKFSRFSGGCNAKEEEETRRRRRHRLPLPGLKGFFFPLARAWKHHIIAVTTPLQAALRALAQVIRMFCILTRAAGGAFTKVWQEVLLVAGRAPAVHRVLPLVHGKVLRMLRIVVIRAGDF